MAMLVHKAVEVDNLTKKGRARLESLLGPRAASALVLAKLDGVYIQFKFLDGRWRAFSRTGEPMPSMETTTRLDILSRHGSPSIVYIGEAWAPHLKHAEINGMARRQFPQHDLHFIVHDTYSTLEMAVTGEDRNKYTTRLDRAHKIAAPGVNGVAPFMIAPHLTIEALMKLAKDAVKTYEEQGLATDGMILRDNDAPFTPGSGKDGGIYKLKPRKSLDLRIIGTFAERRATKLGGYVTVEYRGKPTDVGSGLSQDQLQVILDYIEKPDLSCCHRDPHLDRIAEVEFLDFTKDGRLREPVLKGIRFDKEAPDV